jgi:hypothetical protein
MNGFLRAWKEFLEQSFLQWKSEWYYQTAKIKNFFYVFQNDFIETQF